MDKATIFFISISFKAFRPAISIVIIPKYSTNFQFNNPLKRNMRYTPAVTRVDEWTKEETGVGAAIAAGSQAEKGICALLVKQPKHKNRQT